MRDSSERQYNICITHFISSTAAFKMNTILVGNRIITPSKIVCIGRNYVDHILELNNDIPDDMVVFCKPNSAISKQLVSFNCEQLHYEAELCFTFENGKFSAVGLGLDLTKRELQSRLKAKGLPWERAKAFNGSALFSSFVELSKISLNLSFELTIDSKIVQSGNCHNMIYKPDDILSEIMTFMNLNDGDIVMTGTPKGVGVIKKDQKFIGTVKEDGNDILNVTWTAK